MTRSQQERLIRHQLKALHRSLGVGRFNQQDLSPEVREEALNKEADRIFRESHGEFGWESPPA